MLKLSEIFKVKEMEEENGESYKIVSICCYEVYFHKK